jgi:hypothetical protein
VTDAGSKAITEEIADEPGLTIDDLYGTLGAIGDAQPTTRALLFIDFNDTPFHGSLLFCLDYIRNISFSLVNLISTHPECLDVDQENKIFLGKTIRGKHGQGGNLKPYSSV